MNSDTFVYESTQSGHLPRISYLSKPSTKHIDKESYENLDDLQMTDQNISTVYSV